MRLNRILIVDNEPDIVDGLAYLLEETESLQLEVYAAYSAQEALKLMNRVRIDIAMLDIRMPQMTGLELQQEILAQWPRCKVIFLTGYSDFTCIQEAVRNGSVDYLLKTEGDEAILGAVRRANDMIAKEWEMEEALRQAQLSVKSASMLLKGELLGELLQGVRFSPGKLASRAQALDMRIQAGNPALLVLAQVYRSDGSFSSEDVTLLMYAVQNITKEWIEEFACAEFLIRDRSQMIVFVQPWSEERWGATVRYVHEVLERIQETCERLLKVRISFAAAAAPSAAERLPQQFEALMQALSRSLSAGRSSILICATDGCAEDEAFESERMVGTVKSYIDRHLNGDLSLAKLADVVGYNPSYLSRLFKQATGEGLSDYIVAVKLAAAKQLLKQQSCRIADISVNLGFAADTYFYRFFKKHTGVTPHEYRARPNM